MTTPARFPLTKEELDRITLYMSPYERSLFNSAIADAKAAGRDQGLREAKEVCEANPERQQADGSYIADQQACAAAIEQLRGK